MLFRQLRAGKKHFPASNPFFSTFFDFNFLFSKNENHIIYVRKLFFEVEQFVVSAFRLLYVFISGGEKCAVCGRSVFLHPVCRTCLKAHFSVKKIMEKDRCVCCGKELVSMKEKCMKCRENPVLQSTDCIIPLFSYRLWNRELMFRWKMQGERIFSPLFAKLLCEVLRKKGHSVLVPVPPRKGKIRKNGWDQIEELCVFLQKRYGFGVLRILERNSTGQQKKLSRTQRLESIKTAYSMCSASVIQKALRPFSGKMPECVCLIDDVCTTGSTIESCARLLKEAGIKKVDAVTLFTVD